jgi:hypothetical protein
MISLLSIFIPAGIHQYRDFLKINAAAVVTVMAAYLVAARRCQIGLEPKPH